MKKYKLEVTRNTVRKILRWLVFRFLRAFSNIIFINADKVLK